MLPKAMMMSGPGLLPGPVFKFMALMSSQSVLMPMDREDRGV